MAHRSTSGRRRFAPGRLGTASAFADSPPDAEELAALRDAVVETCRGIDRRVAVVVSYAPFVLDPEIEADYAKDAFGALGLLLLSRSSDHFRERRWHVAGTLIVGSVALYATTFLGGAFWPTMALLCVAAFFIFGRALFWSSPPTYLSAEAAATGIAVIGSIGILGGFVSPSLIGFVRDWTGSIGGGLAFMTALIVTGGLVTLVGVPAEALRAGDALPDAAH